MFTVLGIIYLNSGSNLFALAIGYINLGKIILFLIPQKHVLGKNSVRDFYVSYPALLRFE